MNNVIFYTSHRQLDEIYYSSLFFNRSNYLKNNFDVILHCNNVSYSIDELKNKSLFDTKTHIILTSKNSGYNYGAFEALSDNFELLKNYNCVIHTHPDCYLVNSDKLEKTLPNIKDIAVSKFYHLQKNCYSCDFFIFKPNFNYFKNWNTAKTHVAEHWFYDLIHGLDLQLYYLNRYDNDIAHHNIDKFGIWHNHNLNDAKNYLKIF
jgi:hypothetical protein